MSDRHENFLEFAAETVFQAGRFTLGYFRTGVDVDRKSDNTPVTEADLGAEQLIRSRIEKQYPTHAILGEEYGLRDNDAASHRWFIDPIDGTKSFVRGVPLYAVLLALEIEGQIEAGACYFPALDEMVYAAVGQGCYWNGRRAQVSTTKRLKSATISCTDPLNFDRYGRRAAWEALKQSSYYRVGWTDAYGHALVATGRIELMLDPIMSPWDCGPFPVILREAGGYFGDWSGNETIYGNEGLGTTKTLLPEVLKLIEESGPDQLQDTFQDQSHSPGSVRSA